MQPVPERPSSANLTTGPVEGEQRMEALHSSAPPPVLFLAPRRWYSAHCGARSLAELGVRVYMLSHLGLSPSNLSRYCSGTFPVGYDGRPLGDQARIVSDLRDVGVKLGPGTVLVPATDEWAVFMAEHQHELAELFRFPSLPASLATSLASKQGLHRIASEHGLATPVPVVPRSLAEALDLAQDLRYPVMVKPEISRPSVETKMVVDGPEQLVDRLRELAEADEAPNLVFQEFIPGNEDWTFTGYFDAESRCLAGFTGLRLRTQPPHMGHTSLGMCLRNSELHEVATGFLAAVGYRGIVDAEFRYDARDRVYKVLDVNPRVGGNFRVFVDVHGMDVVRALYLDMVGRRVPMVEPQEGRLWMKEDSDLISFVHLRRAGELDLRGWVRSLRGLKEGATFSVRDPMPFLTAMVLMVGDTLEGKLRRPR